MGDVYEFHKGKGLPLDSFNKIGINPAIAYGHLYTQYSEVINEVNLFSEEIGVLSKKGDILFPGSSTVPYGTAQANAIMLDNVMLGGDIIIARSKNEKINPAYISYLINSQKRKLYPITVGTTITHMYGKDISKLEYMFPNFSEQSLTGHLFIAIENLIALHQRMQLHYYL